MEEKPNKIKIAINPDLVNQINDTVIIRDIEDASLTVFGVMSCYIAEPRSLFCWRDDPVVPPEEGVHDYASLKMAYDDYSFLDGVCQRVSQLPCVAALVERIPALRETRLYSGHDSEASYGGMYTSPSDEVDLNKESEIPKGCTIEHMMAAHLAHEIRHGAHNHGGCFAYKENPDFQNNFSTRLAFQRVYEADATVFSIVAAYDYLLMYGDDGLLRGMSGFSRRPSVKAYLRAIEQDPNAHENGVAAQNAFEAYFSRANAKLLKNYDVTLCDHFAWSVDLSRSYKATDPSQLNDSFWKHVQPMRQLPFMRPGENVLHERAAYTLVTPQNQSLVFGHFSHEAREILRNAKKGIVTIELC